MQGLRLQLPLGLWRPAPQLLSRLPLLQLLFRHRDVKPFLQRRMNALPLDWSNVRAVARLVVVDLDLPRAGGEGQVVRRVVEAPGLLVAFPDRVAVAAPGERVVMNHLARRYGGHDHPRQKTLRRGVAQVPRRFPATAAGVVERRLSVFRQRVASLRLWAAEVERDNTLDSRIERRGDRGRIA